jgi:acyl-CoA synthetase (AMP-forming)/AMP-acid ligase II/thioesterase domain-containing protein/aryl carrier-like protein
MEICKALEERAQQNPNSLALLALNRAPLTYSRLITHCCGVIADLNHAGISRGDRVAVVLPNGPEMAACMLAVAMGASCAPLNPNYRRSEFEFYLSDLAPRALIVEEGADLPAIAVAESLGIRVIRLLPATADAAGIFTLDLEQAPANVMPEFAQPGDEALVLHTSGTTARPKMVPLTQANLAASIENIIATLALTPRDRCLNVMPLFHVSGIIGVLLASLSAGASVVCTPGFYAPHFFEWCREFAPSWYSAVPAMHQSILARAREHPEWAARSKFRFIRSGAAPLAPALMAEMERVFEVPVVEAYGLTETAQQVSVNPLPPGERREGSVGVPGQTDVGIISEEGELLASGQMGEIVVRGPAVMAAYSNNPIANRESFTNGWFRTGDQGRLDADGYLYVTGRIKEIINRGGQKISPREIDEVIGAHPAIAQAVTFPIPDSRLGEDIAAAVVLKAKDSITKHGLRSFIADRVTDYKVPRQIHFVDRIPTGASGKVRRIDLAALLGIVGSDSPALLTRAPYVAPSSETEKTLTEIWTSVLGVEHIGIQDDFLSLGGDSLLLAQLVLRLHQAGWRKISILTFFDRPTIAGLAELIDAETRSEPGRSDAVASERNGATIGGSSLAAGSDGRAGATNGNRDEAITHWPIQPLGKRPPLYVMGSFNDFIALAWRLGLDQPVLGVAIPSELKLRIPYRLEELAAAQVESILKYQTSGPYFLAGFSAEGVLAFEVARQLTAKGSEVGLLVLVDTACPAEPDPFLIRMMRNAQIHISDVSHGGVRQLRQAASGIVRRQILRFKINSWRFGRPLGIPVGRPAPREPMDVILANVIATRSYVAQPYCGRVLLFKRTLDLIGRYRQPDNGWGRVVGDGLEVYRIEGDHLALLVEPGVDVVAEKLAEALGIKREERMAQTSVGF